MAKKHFTSDAARMFMMSDDIPEKMKEDMEKEGLEVPAPAPAAPAKAADASEPQVRLSIYVPKSYHTRIKQEAAAAEMTISEYVISLIERGRRA